MKHKVFHVRETDVFCSGENDPRASFIMFHFSSCESEKEKRKVDRFLLIKQNISCTNKFHLFIDIHKLHEIIKDMFRRIFSIDWKMDNKCKCTQYNAFFFARTLIVLAIFHKDCIRHHPIRMTTSGDNERLIRLGDYIS